jgi:hypothetical protein
MATAYLACCAIESYATAVIACVKEMWNSCGSLQHNMLVGVLILVKWGRHCRQTYAYTLSCVLVLECVCVFIEACVCVLYEVHTK